MVYVGQMFNSAPYGAGRWKYGLACHMLADTDEELHKMALRLKLKRSWFQNKNVPHYDLTKSKRAKAVKAGAKEISFRDEGEMIREWRKQCQNGK